MAKLVLVDGNNLVFRSYYATAYTGNVMRNSKGVPTNAIFGLANMMNKILKDEQPDYLLVAFDKGKTFRHTQYGDYKAGRADTPDELKEQFPKTKELLDKMGIKWLETEGFEADDIIGTMSKIADDALGIETVIISSDKDLLQLISDKTYVKLISKGDFVKYDEAFLLSDKGVTPKQIIDMKGLEGDASDNIPGVSGIGAKTALKLIQQYGSIEGVYEHIDEIKGKMKEKLENDKTSAFFSKEIATIIRDVPIEINIEDTLYNGYNRDELIDFYREYEFNQLIKRLQDEQTNVIMEASSSEVILIENVNLGIFKDGMAISIELDGENYHKANILGIGVYHSNSKYYIPFDVFKNYPKDILTKFKNISIFDYKRSRVALLWAGFDLLNIDFDMFLGAYILNYNIKNDIAYLSDIYGYTLPFNELILKNKNIDLKTLSEYATSKCEFIYKNKERMLNELKENNQEQLFADLEMKLSFVLSEMEYAGITIDTKLLEDYGLTLKEEINSLQNDIYEMSGYEFNIASFKQLGEVLFEKMMLPYPKKKKATDSYSTAADILEKLINHHPIIEKIMRYRELTKLNSTYVEGLLNVVFSDGKIHTIFNQALTATGRLSSIEPNIQNIPIRTDLGKEIRKAFVGSNGNQLLVADYSQIELRVMAHIASSANLIEAFNTNQDIHTKTASEIFGVDPDKVTSTMRRGAKAVNFGIIYGISGFGLSQNLDIDFNTAQSFINRYLEKYPEVKQYMEDIVTSAKSNGYVETIMGRRRYLPDINASNYMQRQFAERMAMNTPIQGSAADIIKMAMILAYEKMVNKNVKSKLIVQVHDELIFDIYPGEEKIMEEIVIESMEHAYDLVVPLEVGFGFGTNWLDAK